MTYIRLKTAWPLVFHVSHAALTASLTYDRYDLHFNS